ncbi:hypothetical protein ACFL59_00785 [Planctomycetota bacterium]
MSTGGVGGISPTSGFEGLEDLSPLQSDTEGAEGAQEAPVLRDTQVPPFQQLQSDTSGIMLAADLEQALADAATVPDSSDVIQDVEEATTPEIQERIDWIESELSFLYDYEDFLLDELESPDLDLWDSFSVECELWDVEFDIEDLEWELADCKGEVYERALTGDFVDTFASVYSSFVEYFNTTEELKVQDGAFEVDAGKRQQQFAQSLREKERDRLRKADSEKLAAAKQGHEVPPLTAEARSALQALQPRFETLVKEPNSELARELLDELRPVHGRQRG